MLNREIKRRIDAARDVLVGQIPDPKGQVEQITTALVYKFMGDLDRRSEEAGGKRSFFVHPYSHFAWDSLMDSKLGGGERRDLYAQAVEGMAANEHLPETFRAMFKGVFLPFRDPRILTLFLKEIDALPYHHSEDLGNPFEYLLSIMGTQGDAGQFRTPRHIIDFIVAAIDPQKGERIHDPACGTAGFLISAFRHMQAANTKNIPGDTLSPNEKRTLTKNLSGYELDPGMARLSLVNMYLHGIRQPQIREYDALTYDESWDESYDVILANPPFMTPKGGIQPHGRFAVRAKRSEVLFVDYIAEHLSPRGRAGVIVPEGIVFQSQRAYKELRRLLVTDWGLWAVISLPAGVFNPYSGVKTSVLLLDKVRAKKTEEILFVKVRADGFDLGAQRRPIADDDLPQAQEILSAWKRGEKLESSELALWAAKDKIAEDDEYNLTAERYRAAVDYSRAKWPMVKLGDVCEVRRGTSITKSKINEGKIPVIAGGRQPAYYHNESNRAGEIVTVSGSGAYAGFVNYFTEQIFASDCSTIQSCDEERALTKFVYFCLRCKQKEIYQLRTGMAQPHIYPKNIQGFSIPLPPLAVQEEIVAEVDGYQRVIDGARLAIANWKPTITINPTWPMVKVGEICRIQTGKKDVNEGNPDGKYPFFTCAKNAYFSDVFSFDVEALLIAGNGDVGSVKYYKGKFEAYQRTYVLTDFRNILARFLYFVLRSSLREFVQQRTLGNTMPYIRVSALSGFPIPFPPLDEQRRIVAKIEEEETAIAACRRLIDSHEEKIRAKIADLWGEK